MIMYYIGSVSDVGMPELSGGLSNVRHDLSVCAADALIQLG